MPAAISAAAPSPCTRTGTISTCTPRQRRRSTSRKSRIAAPVGLVTKAIRRGNRGSGRLRAGVEQSLGRQPLAQLAQRQLERAQALGLDLVDDELIAAARGVDVEIALADHFQAVVQVESHPAGRRAPHHGANLRLIVLERQVAVARLRAREVRNLAADPHRRETGPSSMPLIWSVNSRDRQHGSTAESAAVE